MDLTKYRPTPEQLLAAEQLLRYQPFILDDVRHLGVAYSWLYADDPTTVTPQDLFFDRHTVGSDVWTKAYDANTRLQSMYDAFIKLWESVQQAEAISMWAAIPVTFRSQHR